MESRSPRQDTAKMSVLMPSDSAEQVVARRVLIIDDNEDSRDVLTRFLQLSGHVVCAATDGVDALAIATEFRPDVVFVDLCMPVMDGFEVCARLRGSPGMERIAIFAVSADAFTGAPLGAAARFNGRFVKPLNLEVIRTLVSRLPVRE